MSLTEGLYYIDPLHYHADPCPQVSLSSSGISTLLNSTPAHFQARNLKLTPWPDHIEEPTAAQDLGTIIHKLVLLKGTEIDVHPFDDWRTKDARAARDESRRNGRIPTLPKIKDKADEVADYALAALQRRFGKWPIGESEVTMIWKRITDDNTEVWARALADHLDVNRGLIVDLKTTEKLIGDVELARKFASEGTDIQAAWYTEGLATLFPALRGRAQFVTAVIEVEPPFATRFATFPQKWLHLAGLRCDRAAAIFAECMNKNEWPGWSEDAQLEMPVWRELSFTNAEIVEAL